MVLSHLKTLLPLALLGTSASHAIVINLTPVADGRIQGTNISRAVLAETDAAFSVSQSGSLIHNGVYEFSLASLPSGATINSATFSLTTTRFVSNTGGNPAPVELYDYVGNGTLETDDFDAGDGMQIAPTIFLASGTGATGTPDGTTFTFTLNDFSDLLAANAGSDNFGIRTETNSFADVRTAASENTSFAVPTLTIDYTPVPEPSTSLLTVLAALALSANRRRR